MAPQSQALASGRESVDQQGVATLPSQGRGHPQLAMLVASWRSSFPDGEIIVEDMVAEGDLVAARMLERGTHLGDGRLPPEINSFRRAWRPAARPERQGHR